MTEILLVLIVLLLLILVYSVRKIRVEPRDIESAFFSVWRDSGLDEKIGTLTSYADQIREDYRSLDKMLRVQVERASLGELALEKILSDQLPPDVFGIRKQVLNGKVPDAHIVSTVGVICVDSKFPLDNYRKMVEADETGEKGKYKKAFLRDVTKHLDKVANDYVCPKDGSAEFAFVFIPSESVYYFLVTDAYDTLRTYTPKGVQVVSPLTLSHKVELIKAGIHAKKLTEQADQIQQNIFALSKQFKETKGMWQTFYTTHLRNTVNKAEEIDRSYKKLEKDFERISLLSDE